MIDTSSMDGQFIQLFSYEECERITASGPTKADITKTKDYIHTFLAQFGITITNERCIKHYIATESSKDSKEWHHDDVTILNFIINIRGEGTRIFKDGSIHVLTQGQGCVMVGDQGYTMLGLPPTLHRGPPDDFNRYKLNILVIPRNVITDQISGPSVCDSNCDLYKRRQIELEKWLNEDLKKAESLI